MTKLSDEWQTSQWLFDELNAEFNFDIDLCATKENSKCDLYCSDYINNHTAHISGNSSFELSELFNTKLVISAFMNPPYSNPKPFIEKAWEDSKYCKIVCLVKCDPSTKWWAIFYEYNKRCEMCLGIDWLNEDRNGDSTYINCPYCKGLGVYNGPKPGCEVRFFPKRIQFDPPQQLIDSGEVWKIKNKWVQKCKNCADKGEFEDGLLICLDCKSRGYKPLSGTTFPCALVIMDRRNV